MINDRLITSSESGHKKALVSDMKQELPDGHDSQVIPEENWESLKSSILSEDNSVFESISKNPLKETKVLPRFAKCKDSLPLKSSKIISAFVKILTLSAWNRIVRNVGLCDFFVIKQRIDVRPTHKKSRLCHHDGGGSSEVL